MYPGYDWMELAPVILREEDWEEPVSPRDEMLLADRLRAALSNPGDKQEEYVEECKKFLRALLRQTEYYGFEAASKTCLELLEEDDGKKFLSEMEARLTNLWV